MSAPAPGAVRPPAKTLIAGVGNIFLGDDGFGVEAVRRLGEHPLPDDVEIVDTGVRGVHLAYQMLDGYDTVLLVDAAARGAEPGTVHLLDATEPATPRPRAAALDAHHMTPDAVLALLDTLSAGTDGRPPRRVLVVGCEPADTAEGIGLSDPVEAAVDEAVGLILRLVGADAKADAKADADADADADTDADTDTTERSTTPC
ncbi:peptidase M52 [Streptomyces nigrescens]|uniref:Peptidase M52 n=2 Tax=Streptomyces TaxID=1883 RepID=A0ABM7ZVT6_STRNI|nr:hydrogenase maturation protease [Streptomyces nigrescens]MEE4419464.1 hydrogenase maturation protease [Streptomyces sp. DSM 41528]BDM70443.1 peptidase M52 [Streptomyces nigrescens]